MELDMFDIFSVLSWKTQMRKARGWRVTLVLVPQVYAANLVPSLYFLKRCCV